MTFCRTRIEQLATCIGLKKFCLLLAVAFLDHPVLYSLYMCISHKYSKNKVQISIYTHKIILWQ